MLCTAARTNKSDFHPSNTEAALQSLTWKGLPCSLVHVGLEMELKWLTTLVIIGACLASRGEPKDFKSWLEHGCRSICSGIQAPTFILSLWRAYNWVEGGNQAFLTWTLPWKIMRKTEMKRNVSWLCWLFFFILFLKVCKTRGLQYYNHWSWNVLQRLVLSVQCEPQGWEAEWRRETLLH